MLCWTSSQMPMSEGGLLGRRVTPCHLGELMGLFLLVLFYFCCYFCCSLFFWFFFKEQLLFDALRMLGERVVEEASFWLKPKKFGSEKDGLFFS